MDLNLGEVTITKIWSRWNPVTFVGVDGTTNLCGGQSCSAQAEDRSASTGSMRDALRAG